MKLKLSQGKFLLAGLFGAGVFMGCLNSNDAKSPTDEGQNLRSQGVIDDSTQWEKGGPGKQMICHIPPGNPANMHTINVGKPAIPAHLAHGDKLGACADTPVNPPVIIPPTSTPPDSTGHGGNHGTDTSTIIAPS